MTLKRAVPDTPLAMMPVRDRKPTPGSAPVGSVPNTEYSTRAPLALVFMSTPLTVPAPDTARRRTTVPAASVTTPEPLSSSSGMGVPVSRGSSPVPVLPSGPVPTAPVYPTVPAAVSRSVIPSARS